jgi:hypothetical protein
LPFLKRRISFSTSLPALGLYFRFAFFAMGGPYEWS